MGAGRAAGGDGEGEVRRWQLRGVDAIGRALDQGQPVRLVLHRRGGTGAAGEALIERVERCGIPHRAVSARELRRLSADGVAADFAALLGPDPGAALEEALDGAGAIWMLVGTAYPGNAGFVIRTAEVSGAAGVVIDADFDRAARRDAGRIAMGADRYLPVFFESAERVLPAARERGLRVVAIEDVGTHSPWEVDLRGPVIFVVGGEEHGLPEALLSEADEVLRIPMQGFVPSYNLQAAMAAVVSERMRQEGVG
jgi:23S rRNA (guanosine2251-2'-O)-methyltransferase